jgi:hypothetical protein
MPSGLVHQCNFRINVRPMLNILEAPTLLGNFRQPVQGFNEPRVIERPFLLHDKKNFRRDHAADKLLRVFFRVTLPDQTP